MLLRVFSATITARVLVAIPLLLFLVSCGKNATSTSGATPSQQRTTPKPGATPSQQTVSSNVPQSRLLHSISIDVANIHIYSGEGIVCLNYPTINTNNSAGLHANLVLATDRLTYDSSELQQMKAYATAAYGADPSFDTASPSSTPPPPSTLSWVQGTIVGDVMGRSFASNLLGTGCFAEMDLTNTGNNPILIRSINMQLTAMPVPISSSYQYRMIDICSLIGNVGCPPQAGGSGPVFDYFRLKAASSGTVFMPEQNIHDPQHQSGSDIMLNPTASDTLPVIFYFTSLDSLVYSLTPELLLDTSNGAQQTVMVPQLATTLYFANPSQFSCYTLQGDTFVQGSTDPQNSYCV